MKKHSSGSLSFKLNGNYSGSLKNYLNKEIVLGIRPEDIYDSTSVSSKPEFAKIKASLEVVEPMGNEIFLYFLVDNEQFVARIPSAGIHEPKKEVELLLNTNKLHFFDVQTELAVR